MFKKCQITSFIIFIFLNFSFGKRIGGAARRHNECLILEPSEMIVVSQEILQLRTNWHLSNLNSAT